MHDDRILQIIENLLHETVPKSISLRVVVEQSKARVGRGGASTFKQTYFQTADGQRMFEEWIGGQYHKAS